MNPLQEAIRLRQQLANEWNAGNPNLDKCGELLGKTKVVFTNLKFLPGSSGESSMEELMVARDVLEIGAFWSIKAKNIPSFERYMAQLKCYYLDFKNDLQESSFKNELLGLNLLCLLSANRVADFHTELELFAHPDVHFLDNVYIKHVVSLEQYIMEGRYNKIFQAKRLVPSEAYNYFIDILLDTIREEISACVEKSYTRLQSDAAMKALNLSEPLLKVFAAKRGWSCNGNVYTFNTGQKPEERIQSFKLAQDSIEYAKELEMIV